MVYSGPVYFDGCRSLPDSLSFFDTVGSSDWSCGIFVFQGCLIGYWLFNLGC